MTEYRRNSHAGIQTMGTAINMASWHPAQMFGLEESGLGSLRIGGPADLITYRWDEGPAGELVITNTVSRGRSVFAA